MKKLNSNKLLIPLMGIAVALTACEKTDRSFSLADAGSTFQQSPVVVQRKLDILWVVDNSGSMDSSQTNLTASFSSFINRFQSLNYDFKMAVISTDAWRANYVANNSNKEVLRSLRIGRLNFTTNPYTWATMSCKNQVEKDNNACTGVRIMDKDTFELSNAFVLNATQGTNGTGDERAFSSIQTVLDHTDNADFRRPDAALAIIIVSDEDDFSANTSTFIAADYDDESDAEPMIPVNTGSATDIFDLYADVRLDPVANYKTYLDSVVGAGNYSVNMIGILDTQCKADLNASYGGRRIGRRYVELADMTNGVKTSLCDNFGTSLQLISDSIISLTSTFKLGRQPIPSTIQVLVNNVIVPQDANNGWTYNDSDWTVTFHGSAVPAQGASVQILFTPLTADN